jgi:asparagine synthase (glutamine-hydrolysing)
MGERMRRPTQEPASTWLEPTGRGGLGALLGREFGAFGALGGKCTCCVALDGRLVSPAADGPDLLEELVACYRALGTGFVEHLQGSFALALYDVNRQRLVIATDRYSTRPLYWTRLPGGLAFGSELKGFLALPDLAVRIDPAAVASYLRYGRLFGKRTIWRDVIRLPPRTVLEYDRTHDLVRERVYAPTEAVVQQRHALTADRKEALCAAFRRAVLRGYPETGRLGLSLSGGLDSRAILAVIAGENRQVCLRTMGVEGCGDQRVGARLARCTGQSWQFTPLSRQEIGQYVEAMRRYVYLTEGMLMPDGFPGVASVQFADEEKLTVLQRGHGGENARVGDAWPFQVNDEVFRQRTRAELQNYLEQNVAQHPVAASPLFVDSEIRQAVQEPADTYAGFAAQMDSALTPAEVLSLMYLHINEGGSVCAYRNSLRGYVEMALPYADGNFLELVLGTTVADRRDATIHYHLIRKHCLDLMRIPNSNHGAPLDASRFRRVATEKFLFLMRRLGLAGFRHYHSVETWIRQSLLQSIRALLMEPRTRARGLYDATALNQLLEGPDTTAGARLLARLVMVEMWFRMFVDREVEGYQLSLTLPEQTPAGLSA